jgi:hypothetical protein
MRAESGFHPVSAHASVFRNVPILKMGSEIILLKDENP